MGRSPTSSIELGAWKLWWLLFGAGVVGGAVGCAVFVALVFVTFMMGCLRD
jgi:hypothetical protein